MMELRPRPVVRSLRSKRTVPSVPRHPTFSLIHRFEAILEWSPESKRDRIQRLGFKSADFHEAMIHAREIERSTNSLFARNLEEKSKKFCRLIGVYEEKAFKDYSSEPLYNREVKRTEIKKHIESVQQSIDLSKPVKQVRVRGAY